MITFTCDDNGAYRSSNNNKKLFHIQINGSSLNAKLVQQENGKFFYKEKNGRTYNHFLVDEKDVYQIERYYRWNKKIPQLKRTIYRVRNLLKTEFEPHLCVVYFRSCNPESVKDVTILEHGNSRKSTMLNRPYIRTVKSVLTRQEALLNDNKRLQEVYDILLEESGAPYRSASMSKGI